MEKLGGNKFDVLISQTRYMAGQNLTKFDFKVYPERRTSFIKFIFLDN